MMEQVNGGSLATVEPPAGEIDLIAAEVQTGLTRYYEIAELAKRLRRECDAEALENTRLRIELENVREHERNHVQVVLNEARIEQHKYVIENSMLRDELEAQRRELADQRKQTGDARAEVARLTAALSLITANIMETLRQPAEEGDAERE